MNPDSWSRDGKASDVETGLSADGSHTEDHTGSEKHDIAAQDDQIDRESIEQPLSQPGQDGSAAPSHRSSHAISRQSTRASQRTVPPPDGGYDAWVMCICAHVVIANTWGLINSFGIFQAYYADYLKLEPSAISWIGSFQIFLANFIGLFSGRLSDNGHFRLCIGVGSFLLILGAFTTSVCTEYWQLMLAQGIVIGAAGGFLCCPMLSVTATYFSKRRSLAVGIVTCGNVTGGLIYPAMARQLLPTVGFGWALRAIAFMQLGTMIVVNILARSRIKARTPGPIVDWTMLKEVDFMLYVVGLLFGIAGTYVVLYYIPQFSRTEIRPVFSYPESLNLLLIFNGVSLFGRIIPSVVADKLGAVNMLVPSVFLGGVCCFGWMGVTTPGGIYAWTTVYALIGGSLLALWPAGVVSLGKDIRSTGTRMGMAMAINSFAVLIGPPVAGAIITRMGGHYKGAQAFGGCMLLLGATLVFGTKVARKIQLGEKWTAII